MKLQDAIARAYRPAVTEQSTGYHRVVGEVLRWVQSTFGAGEARERYSPARWERLKRNVQERDELRARRRVAGEGTP